MKSLEMRERVFLERSKLGRGSSQQDRQDRKKKIP